jgi:2-C-methyl-D-erythritol 4-phosphate cytidylyltransferase/2-C-methyl-D-erythritol 2,4-cyclodiphosphate synthase
VQTPQAFDYAAILAAHRGWTGGAEAGDDAQVAEAAGLPVALVPGDEALRKVTFASDLETAAMPVSPFPAPAWGLTCIAWWPERSCGCAA